MLTARESQTTVGRPERAEKQVYGRGLLPELTGHLLRRAHLLAQREFAQTFGEPITALQYGALELLMENPGIGHRTLTRALDTSKTVLTTTLKPIIRQGLVETYSDKHDNRAIVYRLTNAGAARCTSIRREIEQVETRITAALSDSERAELNRLLRKMTGFNGAEKITTRGQSQSARADGDAT